MLAEVRRRAHAEPKDSELESSQLEALGLVARLGLAARLDFAAHPNQIDVANLEVVVAQQLAVAVATVLAVKPVLLDRTSHVLDQNLAAGPSSQPKVAG